MNSAAPLSMLLEVLARSQRELERLENEREEAHALKECARSLIVRAHEGHGEKRPPANSEG